MSLRSALVVAATAAATTAGLLTPVTPAAAAQGQPLVADPASVVDPFIGTTNFAADFPGADVPFGMVQWSPDTPHRPGSGGYEYNDTGITGFSLNHLAGAGCGTLGDVPFLPSVGKPDGTEITPFSHAEEKADAGYYKVKLSSGITTELSATTRSGMARFTFPATKQANLLLKLAGSHNAVTRTTVNVVGDNEVTGSVTTGHFCGSDPTYTIYFAARFDRPITGSGELTKLSPRVEPPDEEPDPPLDGPKGEYLTFDTTGNQVVQAKVGVSYVSVDNARGNRDTENRAWDFDGVHANAHKAWNDMLGRVRIGGGTASQQRVFYTALYHSLLHPNVFSDVNGQYIGFDNKVHTAAQGHVQYANFSGWDIYRSQAQLSAMLAPQQASDMARSMLNAYDQMGHLPKWTLNNGETYVMVGDPGTAVLADYYAFGARDFDTKAALNAMVKQASTTNDARPGQNYLTSPGYLPADGQWGCCSFYGPVSTQLEYSTQDFALSAFAGAMGDTANQTRYANRAQQWRALFDPDTGLIQARTADGSWDLDPKYQDYYFVEGTNWQYTGMIPFNVRGLAETLGGRDKLITYLDTLLAGFHGGGKVSDMGNEPSLGLPWEYDFVGQPYKAQRVVREVQNAIWTDQPGGLAGNDDLGTMSAWYVFSALGMYPLIPGTADLALGSPVFTKAVVSLPGGKTLTINAPQAAPDAPYVQSMTVNGARWNNAYLPASTVSAGGTVEFALGKAPNTSWASDPSSAPPSYGGNGQPFVPHGALSSAGSGRCADVIGSGVADGVQVQLWDCNGKVPSQYWAAPGDGSLQAMGKCLDAGDSGGAEGAKVRLFTCAGNKAQQWQVKGGALVNALSGRCLEAPRTTVHNGTLLEVHACNGTKAQSWKSPR
ncbi:lectin [Kutzneria albida]|uniref:Alpha-1,2-mannosidase n=1 Tax=Kutzneria albida DSM 43870 TaxID=1449976 RepID=W5W3K0_9PSEU|nr:lectin [Kutzneria albida]AHH95417.1 alpha-1,2-mannosidase [Kutzneria albida DSM 43870]